MQLYKVEYKEWNTTFSGFYTREMLSVGNNENEAIERVKNVVDSDARDFYAEKIESVFGYNILIEKINQKSAVKNNDVVRCRNCAYHHWEQEPCHGKTEHYCSILKSQIFADFYCYHGQPKNSPKNVISWSLNEENNELKIFLGEAVLATVSDVFPPEDESDYLTGLVDDTLYGMGYKWNTDGTISKMEVNK